MPTEWQIICCHLVTNYFSPRPCGLDFIISILQIVKYRLRGVKSFSCIAHLTDRHLTIELWLQNLRLLYSTKELQTLIYLFKLYTVVLVFPYIDMNQPRVYMCSPSWTSSHFPPRTIPLGHRSAPAPSTLYHAWNLDWRFISHMIIYMFQCRSPRSSHPRPLPQDPKDCSIHLCLFCCLTYRVIVTIFLNPIYMC